MRNVVYDHKMMAGVVSQKKTHADVVDDVCWDHSKRIADGSRYVRAFTHFSKRAISVVVVEKAWGAAKNPGNTVIVVSELVIAAGELLLRAIVNETADEKVKESIIVEVEPNCAGGPPRSGKTGFLGHVAESAVAIVFVQNAASVGSDEDIRPSIIVLVADSNAHSKGSASRAS